MGYVGGALQAAFMGRVREVPPNRRLVVPVDVGKTAAMALVADISGEMIVRPFRFALNTNGRAAFAASVTFARAQRDALVCRVGVEAAGHYHRTLRVSPGRGGDRGVVGAFIAGG